MINIDNCIKVTKEFLSKDRRGWVLIRNLNEQEYYRLKDEFKDDCFTGNLEMIKSPDTGGFNISYDLYVRKKNA